MTLKKLSFSGGEVVGIDLMEPIVDSQPSGSRNISRSPTFFANLTLSDCSEVERIFFKKYW